MKLTKPMWVCSWSLLYESSCLCFFVFLFFSSCLCCWKPQSTSLWDRLWCKQRSHRLVLFLPLPQKIIFCEYEIESTIIGVYHISRILGEVIPFLRNLFCGDCNFICEACHRAKGGNPPHRKNILLSKMSKCCYLGMGCLKILPLSNFHKV